MAAPRASDPRPRGLTAVTGVTVGHHVRAERPTGCTAVLVEGGAVPGVDVRGGAPGTREIALLDPVNSVAVVHGVVLAGGSAFGLATASGVMRYLDERGVGYPTRVGKVPIVPAAILYDLEVDDRPEIRPGEEDGYRAAAAASARPVEEGSVGAGAGASVGKLAGMERAMRGGLGSAALAAGELVVAALAAVNPVGDVIDPATGEVVAGVRAEDGSGRAEDGGSRAEDGRFLSDARRLIASRLQAPAKPWDGTAQNTTLGVVATNARLTKAQATKVAQMAQDGIARAISPAHTPYDGDVVFVLATGDLEHPVELLQVGALAADAIAEAILRGVRRATGLPGLPAAGDLADHTGR